MYPTDGVLFPEMRVDHVSKGDGDKGGNIKYNRCGEVDHKTVPCPG